MVDFRRCITALALLTLFVGLGVAQTQPGLSALQCATSVTVTPRLRAEGFTEQTGDITLTCTGGTLPTQGSIIPTVNFTLFYNSQVTSRLIPSTAGGNNVSEALLLIDEPGSGLVPVIPGTGPAAAQTLCTTPAFGAGAAAPTGCQETVNLVPNPVQPNPPIAVPVASAGGVAANVFQGIVAGNSVTFNGIPVLAPGTTSSRVFRFTNVRIDATQLGGGSASVSGFNSVQASISVSGATSLLIQGATVNVGVVSTGLSAASSSSTNVNQCTSQTKISVNTISFTEGFATAFKTRFAVPASQNFFLASTGNLLLGPSVPGAIFNSESNFVFGVTNGTAGVADFGTRLKATFTNIPTGVTIFVSTANVQNNNLPVVPPNPIGGSATTSFAELVTSETTPDSSVSSFSFNTAFFPSVTATDNGPNGGNVPIAAVNIDPTTHSGTAVWEVLNTSSSSIETFNFGVYISTAANVSSGVPAQGQSTVSLSFAPTPPAFAASDGAKAQPSGANAGLIPRFSAGSIAGNIFAIQICRTILLYPFVTNQAGFDTGIAIANTSLDSFTTGSKITASQTGTCILTWFGGTTAAPTTPPAATTTPAIAGGTVYVNTAQALVPAFQGYMIAVCNFQFAHGFAFISDVGARNLAMGYLAVVLNDPGLATARSNTNTTTNENGGH